MYVERPGARLYCEVEGEGSDLFLCPPCYPIVHSEIWKYQVPYLRQRFRLITHDLRSNGRSECTAVGLDFRETQYGDFCAVLDATAHPPTAIATMSCGSIPQTAVAKAGRDVAAPPGSQGT